MEQLCKSLLTDACGLILGIRNVKAPLDPTTVRSILVLRNDAIGDMVLTTPLWRVIKKHYPHIRIGVAASFRNLPLIEHDPDVDVRYDCTDGDFRALLETRRAIRKGEWDLVMPMIYYRKTKMAFLARFVSHGSLTSMLLKPPESSEHYLKLFSIVARSPYDTNDIEMIEQSRMHLVGTLDMEVSDDEWRPSLYADEAQVAVAQERIDTILKKDGTTGHIHLNLEAKSEFKEYGVERSLELSRELRERYPDHSILWTSSPVAASKAVAFLEANAVPGVHFFPTRSIHELIGLVRRAALVITPDTSVVHIASAEGRPVLGLYHVPHEWPPYKTEYRRLLPVRGEPVSTIPVSEALQACEELLAYVSSTSPSVAARD